MVSAPGPKDAEASEPDPEAEGGKGEAEGRVPPGLPILSRHNQETKIYSTAHPKRCAFLNEEQNLFQGVMR